MAAPELKLIELPAPDPSLMDHLDAQSFLGSAIHNLQSILQHVALGSDAKVLDVGCGTGRMAYSLLPLLDSSRGGRYIGIDSDPRRLDWALKRISPKHANAIFLHLDLFHAHYNPRGRLSLANLTFGLPDKFFDAVLAHSLFTHLNDAAARRYLEEITRLLKPGGWFYLTGYFWDDESVAAEEGGQTALAFPFVDGIVRFKLKESPEAAVSLSRSYLWNKCKENDWRLVAWLPGLWRKGVMHGQDIVIWQSQI